MVVTAIWEAEAEYEVHTEVDSSRKNEQLEGAEQKKGLGCRRRTSCFPLIQKMNTDIYLVVSLEGRS